mmetsp:Transcript_20746/g.45466  ORF Transcript_20746/g.45466 Transcript_20746/m.45466 type:complete len:433 (-) Transcript_20746:107-1405(-)|eukprot:CAMPEP_0118930002 /NCGR_PEP_ID=MMETSP1169-20130426/6833_1 /TAXON_ID=36882 /ORGANISM="Pyramimonas obovata, Strain CCMP722" /LENGTH=432 /DNA_ID=CAMNT_0006872291 /DNA_START=294 /DNA_END=1592 /DNA_ORIENTATION=-
MEVPGTSASTGKLFGLFKDETISFGLDPLGFVKRKVEKFGPIFATRLLNKYTIVVGCQEAMEELVNQDNINFENGYSTLMESLYGDGNIVLADGDHWSCLRRAFGRIFSAEQMEEYIPRLLRPVDIWVKSLPQKQDVNLYPALRDLFTDLSVSLMLDLDDEMEEDEAVAIKLAAREHWRGLVTLQSGLLSKTYRTAQKARDRLLRSIVARLRHTKLRPDGIPARMLAELGEGEAANQLLLLVSALVPKALASILTSLVHALALQGPEEQQRCCESQEHLACYLREVERMWPPFFGGFRVCTHPTELLGFKISKGDTVLYAIHMLNKDPAVFEDPERMDPSRWEAPPDGRRSKVWSYGGGPRECFGRQLSNMLIQRVASAILAKYVITEQHQSPYKWLPVARPQECHVRLSHRTKSRLHNARSGVLFDENHAV